MKKRVRYDGRFGGQYEDGRYHQEQMQLYLNKRSEILIKTLNKHFPDRRELKILEVGCGTGLSLQYLAQSEGSKQLFGMDLSRTMLAQSAAKLENLQRQKNLVIGNAINIPYSSGMFDCVFATRFIHQFSHTNKKLILNEMLRVTANGGIVILEFYAHLFHLFRYYFGKSGRRRKGRKGFLEHYPKMKAVEDIIGDFSEIIPLRFAGSGLLLKVLSKKYIDKITDNATQLPFKVFLDEYFIVKRK